MASLLKDKRIFIIEDNVNNRAIMQLIIEQHGATCHFERWGRDFEERLEKFGVPDLILLDLTFPDKITGYDIFDQIKQIPGMAQVPVVAVSASDPEEAIPKTLDRGFAGFISKPIVNPRLFINQILEVMNGQSVWYAG